MRAESTRCTRRCAAVPWPSGAGTVVLPLHRRPRWHQGTLSACEPGVRHQACFAQVQEEMGFPLV